MKCPACGSDTHVIDTVIDKTSTHRRRECYGCGNRFTTKETVTDEPMPSRRKKYGYGKVRGTL